jgi:hypothetical protein
MSECGFFDFGRIKNEVQLQLKVKEGNQDTRPKPKAEIRSQKSRMKKIV